MLSYLVQRALSLLTTVFVAAILVFLVLEVLPGDPALLMLGVDATDENLATVRQQFGLDRPAFLRFFIWIHELVTLNLGESYQYRTAVSELIWDRMVVTVPLTFMALILSTLIAVPLGMFAASRHNKPGDYGVMAFSQIGIAIPNFWFGILLTLLFSVHLAWFASGGFPGWQDGVWPAVKSLILPATALALTEAAILARVTRSAILETLREDYVRTARAKGLSRGQVMRRHVLRNALIPVATIVGLQFAFLLAGTIIVENVFYLPGLGQLLYRAIEERDVIVVKNVVVLIAAFVVLVNFAVDLLYALIDPRPKRSAA